MIQEENDFQKMIHCRQESAKQICQWLRKVKEVLVGLSGLT